jgi:hypothetical protein
LPQQRAKALEYAKKEEARHRKVERRYRTFFIVFQALTIAAAALATVFAVSDSIAEELRAIPAAIATLGASVLAAFQFRGAWHRHRDATRRLRYEIS